MRHALWCRAPKGVWGVYCVNRPFDLAQHWAPLDGTANQLTMVAADNKKTQRLPTTMTNWHGWCCAHVGTHTIPDLQWSDAAPPMHPTGEQAALADVLMTQQAKTSGCRASSDDSPSASLHVWDPLSGVGFIEFNRAHELRAFARPAGSSSPCTTRQGDKHKGKTHMHA